MSFGFLGIQFEFGFQLANMSAIYSKLGAEPDKIPILWQAGPMTGLQQKLGKRRLIVLQCSHGTASCKHGEIPGKVKSCCDAGNIQRLRL